MRLQLVIAVLVVAIAAADNNADDAMLESFAERPECMTMLSRVYYASSDDGFDEMKLVALGARRLVKSQLGTFGLGREVSWQQSYWGSTCDPGGAVLQRLEQINLVPLASATELSFMAQLREHRDHDLEQAPAWTKDRRNLDRALGNHDESVPVPGRSWIWQDYVLVFAGIPLVLALVAVCGWAFSASRRARS